MMLWGLPVVAPRWTYQSRYHSVDIYIWYVDHEIQDAGEGRSGVSMEHAG
jgi:hypothetical protein